MWARARHLLAFQRGENTLEGLAGAMTWAQYLDMMRQVHTKE